MATAKRATKTIQEQLATDIQSLYQDSIIKKINTDNFLEIHIPEINDNEQSHLFFNTSEDYIKIGFYSKDENFINNVIQREHDFIESTSNGLVIIGDPDFENVILAIKAAMKFLARISNNNSLDSNKIINFRAAKVYVEYFHLNTTDLSNFILSINDWFDEDTKEDIVITHGEKGDFEDGASFLKIVDLTFSYDEVVLKTINQSEDNYISYFSKNYTNHRNELLRDKNFIIKKTDKFDYFDENYEFTKFKIDSLTVEYNEGGTICSFDIGNDNDENLVSLSDQEVYFEVSVYDEIEFNGTSFECYILESGEAKLIDLDMVIANFKLTDGQLNIFYK